MQEKIETVIEDTVFRNEENGYSVIDVRGGKKSFTVVGILPAFARGEQVAFQGVWIDHPQYGKQFKAESCSITKPSTLLGIERFLASGIIRGVGPATAKLIIQEFGTHSLDILSENPQELTSIAGIGKKRAAMIAESFQEQFMFRQTMIYLQAYGIAPHLAMKIAKKYGDETQDKLRENPYQLIDDIEGVGFLTADRIAVSIGIEKDSEFRIKYGVLFIVQEASNYMGHTYLPYSILLEKARAMLSAPNELIEANIQALLLERRLILSNIEGELVLFTRNMYYNEVEIAVRLCSLLQKAETLPTKIQTKTIVKNIATFEKEQAISFGEKQKHAIVMALEKGISVITGGPGTGKTTIITCILSLLGIQKTLLAAPTGRAAKRMTEATQREAKTIHRLLEFNAETEQFQRNQENPLECECVIVDEMSMVDVYLMRSLLRALKEGTKLILVGDADQLPSVGAGNVLGDILASDTLPNTRLTDIFRQGEESMIIVNAHRINQGLMPTLNSKNSDFFFDKRLYANEAAKTIEALCTTRLPKFLKTNDIAKHIQVLSPTKKGMCGVIELNKLLQNSLNPPKQYKPEIAYKDNIFRLFDKVIHTKNNYSMFWVADNGKEGEGVFNGDMGVVESVEKQLNTLTVRYDDRLVEYTFNQLEELELAYCLTIHKSQGSEFEGVIIPVVQGPKMLLTRNLFYTALTRAKRLVVLVGREDIIYEMVMNDHIEKRFTALTQRIREAQEKVEEDMEEGIL